MSALIAVHHALDEQVGVFRELVLVGDGARAAAVLAAHRALTERHASDEEAHLVPLLAGGSRWPAELYTGQHAKLLAGLDRVLDAVAGLAAPRAGWRRHALGVLDALAPALHLADHHHRAEEQDLLVIAEARDPALVAALARDWLAAAAAHDALLADARAALRASEA